MARSLRLPTAAAGIAPHEHMHDVLHLPILNKIDVRMCKGSGLGKNSLAYPGTKLAPETMHCIQFRPVPVYARPDDAGHTGRRVGAVEKLRGPYRKWKTPQVPKAAAASAAIHPPDFLCGFECQYEAFGA